MKKYIFSLFFLVVSSMNAYAVTAYIGDVDGFGYGDGSGFLNELGGDPDINNNGILDSGDALPDRNNNGTVATRSGDDFDYRSAAELADTSGAQWTDVSLSTSYSGRPGNPNAASFTFYFTLDTLDPFYGHDHFINLVYADYDVNPMTAVVEGNSVSLLGNTQASIDGAIWRAYASVAWSDMLDGMVTIDINAPNEPYVAFDYALLDVSPISVNPVPEPSTLLLLGGGLTGLFLSVRKRKKA